MPTLHHQLFRRAAHHGRSAGDWIHRCTATHQTALQITYLICTAAGVLADVWMVCVRAVGSISGRIWDACEAHPTLEPAGVLLTALVCYLIRGNRCLVASGALLGGHLFTHF